MYAHVYVCMRKKIKNEIQLEIFMIALNIRNSYISQLQTQQKRNKKQHYTFFGNRSSNQCQPSQPEKEN